MTEKGQAQRKALGGLGSSKFVSIHSKILTLVLGAMFALVALGIAHAPATASDEQGADSRDFAAIDRYVEKEMEATRLPGLALAIVKGDKIVHLKGFGEADSSGQKVTPQTPFVIGSTAKSFTALAIMQLVEEGKVDLDAPVQRSIPWFKLADEEASSRITVRHLLNQTSGLPAEIGTVYLLREDLSPEALAKEVRALNNMELERPPGSSFEYNNMNYSVLGLIVQEVSGEPYEQYIEEHIFAPLKMENSFADYQEAKENGLAQGHRTWFGIPRPAEIFYNRAATPAGYLSSSAEDMAHYLIAQLNGGRYDGAQVLSPEGVDEMHQGAVSANMMGERVSYGMGWGIRELNGVKTVSHSGGTLAYRADMILVPEGKWGVMVLENAANYTNGARAESIGEGVANLLVGRQPPPGASQMLIGLFALVGVLGLQILGIVRSVVLLRRWRARLDLRPQWKTRIALRVGLPLVLSLLWALLSLAGAPSVLQFPLKGLMLMDFGQVLLFSGALALVWGIVRGVLAYRTLRKTGAPKSGARREIEASPVNA
jgi:CubicO group peptidase (beta-lactamase class C family)